MASLKDVIAPILSCRLHVHHPTYSYTVHLCHFHTPQKASYRQLHAQRAVSGVTFLLSRYQISDDADKHPISVQSRNETNEIPVSELGRKKASFTFQFDMKVIETDGKTYGPICDRYNLNSARLHGVSKQITFFYLIWTRENSSVKRWYRTSPNKLPNFCITHRSVL
jgi:hypothetical protein